MKNTVWLTGDAVVDLIPDEKNTYLKCPGGAPANVAVANARLGGKSRFFGRVGDDPMGRFMRETLDDEGVDTRYMVLDPEKRTSTVVVDLDNDGERSFTFMVKPSADQFLDIGDVPEFAKHQWLHCCSIALANEPSRGATFGAMAKMKEAGGYISFDPNLREEVWHSSEEMKAVVLEAIKMACVVKVSDGELMYLTGTETIEEGLRSLPVENHQLLIITLGAKGALVVFNREQRLISGKSVQPVDTTGAGDAFVGGMLAKLSQIDDWRNWEAIQQAVHWANACGAIATTKKGAMSALPSHESMSLAK
ncbi:aminoimidazole riboside kinase [Photobacterium sanctipauli]|uniref:Aminoimidazole riboside kinase n=1 Tax=Photobacterium sanctipauli TaxID=1342794 RepID=A0A2T3NWY3_9GAMM|nr:aminoimidazole riboside kinase [Photobacterium sanctipauli]PSW20732.1 aminoimidazole riboside kinase [Photobacterium sanctipauli]